jgi:hypothetical protein
MKPFSAKENLLAILATKPGTRLYVKPSPEMIRLAREALDRMKARGDLGR